MERIKTYREEFPPGTRVIVRTKPGDGSDHDFNGRTGTVVSMGHWVAVQFDTPPKYYSNPYPVGFHTLRAIQR